MTKSRPCPICKKPRSDALKQQSGSADKYAPFCSARCRDRDLSQWFGDGYAVPGRPALPEEIAAEVVGGKED
jgi:hypothetical protein